MKERPILFSGPMVRALLDGRKTVTRRLVKAPAKEMQREGKEVITHRAPGDPWYDDCVWSMRNRKGVWCDYTDDEFMALCPYGARGDRLWVRETWAAFTHPDYFTGESDEVTCKPSEMRSEFCWVSEEDVVYAADNTSRPDRWRPSIFMPRWASRITLEIVSVRCERLHAITEEDAIAEGVESRDAFVALWEEINGARRGARWADNPFVWRVEFRRIEGR